MKPTFVLALAAASLIATPVFAAPPVKRPACQAAKAPARDARRVELCRKQAIPPIIDPLPMFLASTAGSTAALADFS